MLNYWMTYGSLPALRLLLSRGADVNLAKQSGFMVGHTPLMTAVSWGPDVVRMLLRAGADPEHRAHDFGRSISTAEEQARSDPYCQRSASADLLRDVRLAGGWKRYVLQPKYDLLVLRALCHRRRATLSARTPEVLVRLFSAPDGRRRTFSGDVCGFVFPKVSISGNRAGLRQTVNYYELGEPATFRCYECQTVIKKATSRKKRKPT